MMTTRSLRRVVRVCPIVYVAMARYRRFMEARVLMSTYEQMVLDDTMTFDFSLGFLSACGVPLETAATVVQYDDESVELVSDPALSPHEIIDSDPPYPCV